VQLTDKLSSAFNIDESRVTAEGYLWLRAKLARTGVQEYHASEVGKAGDAIIRVYRPPEQVFDAVSMASFFNKPVTNNHPPEQVTPDNFKKYAVGYAGDKVTREGDNLVGDILITDRAAINAVRTGKVEISNGYSLELEWNAGVTPSGEAYDAIQTKIRGNHIALVDAGRCGANCSIQTDAPNGAACKCNHELKENIMTDKTVLVDGIHLVGSDQMIAAINKLQGEKTAITADCVRLSTSNDANLAKIAALEATIKTRDAKITELTTAAKDESFVEGAINARLAAIDGAVKITGKAFDGKGETTPAIKSSVVKSVLGDTAKDYTAEQIAVAFDTLLTTAKPKDKLADAVRGRAAVDGKQINKYDALNVNIGGKNAN
jgi:uncharacterized protein